MRFLRALCRIIFALVFIFSGIFKLIDPVGTGLIVTEYFSFLHFGALVPLSEATGIILATVEFVTGISILIGLEIKFFAPIALGLTCFFTLLTLYLAIFNPISDCGCFGEAVHLTNWQTFFKNLILLALIIFIFWGRKKATVIASDPTQWILVGLFAVLSVSIALDALAGVPRVDFTAYGIGTDFTEMDSRGTATYETVFTYSKEGRTEEFTLETLPDSTWTFVESTTIQTGGSSELAQIDFELECTEGPFFAISIYNPDKISSKQMKAIERFRDNLQARDIPVKVFDNADRKTMMTMNRSNGGVTYFNDGILICKWGARDIEGIDVDTLLAEDSDTVMLKQRLHQQLFFSIVGFSILLIVFIIGYLCRVWKRR